jgi:hypothetical protein
VKETAVKLVTPFTSMSVIVVVVGAQFGILTVYNGKMYLCASSELIKTWMSLDA